MAYNKRYLSKKSGDQKHDWCRIACWKNEEPKNKLWYGLEKNDSAVGEGTKPKILIHTCCVACSTHTLEFMCQYAEVTLFSQIRIFSLKVSI